VTGGSGWWVNAIEAVGGLSGLIVTVRLLRKPWRAIRSMIHKGRRITAVLVGEDPINDPDSGIELRPAQPDLVTRLTSMQEDARATREIVEKLADVHDDIAAVVAAAARAQETADHAEKLAKRALDAVDAHAGNADVHLPLQRLAEGH